MITNDFSSQFMFSNLSLKDDADELSDEEGDGGAQANEDGAHAEREDDDYFKGALARSFAVGCPPNVLGPQTGSIEESKLGSALSGFQQSSQHINEQHQ